VLDEKRLRDHLPIGGLGMPAFVYRSIGSTNDRAAELASQGAAHGALVAADEQTAGRGRAGRRWITPAGSALAFSLILRPGRGERPAIGTLNAVGALAVVDALAELGASAQIKWPNDVLLRGRKACGILVEGAWMGDDLQAVVLGIGLNVTPDSVPPAAELDYPATCVQAAVDRQIDRVDLLLRILAALSQWLPRLRSQDVIDAWQSRLAFIHQQVELVGGWAPMRGEFLGLDSDGRARLLLPSGETVVHTGEGVSLRPVDRQG
jgi:BirA family biotin operon repressor/biotin-[acetyl-CoA-carboxylase] ligase